MKMQLILACLIAVLNWPTLAEETQVHWIDVRSASEYHSGHVPGALNIEFGDIVAGVSQRGIPEDARIYLYCGSGKRAGIALESLQQAGYTAVENVGGIADALTRFEGMDQPGSAD